MTADRSHVVVEVVVIVGLENDHSMAHSFGSSRDSHENFVGSNEPIFKNPGQIGLFHKVA